VGLALWQSRGTWRGPALPFAWRAWVGRVIPLTMALGASQFMFAADMIMVQAFFAGDTGLYAAAGTIGRGLVLFTAPMAMVMFPKIVRSAALAERSDVLLQAMIATGLLGAMAALGCTLFPKLPFQILNKPDYFAIAPLIPWFAWCMLPLALANVLISNLLARSVFRVAPWLVAVAVAYAVGLVLVGGVFKIEGRLEAFKMVVWTLGGFNLVLLAVAGCFTWKSVVASESNEQGVRSSGNEPG
jgi:O-antigen/teichoic acid export membrane protein